MTIEELIAIADKAYSEDGIIQEYHDKPGAWFGDGLARFIARELKETHEADKSTKEQLKEAIAVMDTVRLEVEQVVEALIAKLENTPDELGKTD